MHLVWNHTSHLSHATPFWLLLTPFLHIPQGNFTPGPGFCSTSPEMIKTSRENTRLCLVSTIESCDLLPCALLTALSLLCLYCSAGVLICWRAMAFDISFLLLVSYRLGGLHSCCWYFLLDSSILPTITMSRNIVVARLDAMLLFRKRAGNFTNREPGEYLQSLHHREIFTIQESNQWLRTPFSLSPPVLHCFQRSFSHFLLDFERQIHFYVLLNWNRKLSFRYVDC